MFAFKGKNYGFGYVWSYFQSKDWSWVRFESELIKKYIQIFCEIKRSINVLNMTNILSASDSCTRSYVVLHRLTVQIMHASKSHSEVILLEFVRSFFTRSFFIFTRT